MAGYIAPATRRENFAQEWSELLRLGAPHWLKLDEFKMAAMMDPARRALGIKQSELFYRVIEKHLEVAISCSLRVDELAEAFNSISFPPWLDNTDVLSSDYFICFGGLIQGLTQVQEELGLNGGSVDFFFDNHADETKCMRAWDFSRAFGPPEVTSRLGATPVFRDSMQFAPLQAADLLAYWIRAHQLEPSAFGDFNLSFPWPTHKQFRMAHIFFTKEMLVNNMNNAISAADMARRGFTPDEVRATLSPGLGLRRL